MTPGIDGATLRTLRVGDLAFSTWEMGEGPLALCLHGFPDTPQTWRHLLPALAQVGFRAVAVTARGYQPTSQPQNGDYSVAALASDVPGLLDALGAPSCHLIGHDWGASIAYAAAAGYPARIKSLTTLAVPHPAAFALLMAKDFGQILRSWYIYYFQLRERPERVIARDDFVFLERLWRKWSPGWDIPREDLEAVRTTFGQPGVVSAALAYYRQAFDQKHPRLPETAHLYGAPITAPTLALTGAKDGCISADVFERAMPPALFSGGLSVQRVEGLGHFLHLERPADINQRIVSHLKNA